MGNPAPPPASYALLSALIGYANGQVLTQAQLDAIGNLVLRGDGQGNFAEIKTARIGALGFLCCDAQSGIWLAENAYTDDGINWFAFNSALGAYALQFTTGGVILNFSPATGAAILWQPFQAFSNTAYDSTDPTEEQIYALQVAIGQLQNAAYNGGMKPLANGPVSAATTAALPANTYNNGSAGVGATLTGNANGALPNIDGVVMEVGYQIWVQNEANGANNGVYIVTQLGSGSTPYILTRRADANTAAALSYGFALVYGGATWAGYALGIALPVADITIGTTALYPFAFAGSVAVAAETARAEGVEATLTADFATVAGAANVFGQSTDYFIYGKRVVLAGVDNGYRKGFAVTQDGYLYAKFAMQIAVANGLTYSYSPTNGFHQLSLGTVDGQIPIGSSSGALIDATTPRYYKGKVVQWAASDANYRGGIILTTDGEVYVPKLQSVGSGAVQGADFTNYEVLTSPVGDLTQLFSYSKSTGVSAQITSAGNNINPERSADGNNVIYSSDRTGSSVRMFQPCGGGTENPVVSQQGLVPIGDSRSTPSLGYVAQLALLYPSRYIDESEGVGGQRSDEIAQRFCAKTISYTVSGNSIPASGSVNVSIPSGDFDPFYHWNNSGGGAIHGQMNGIPGTLSIIGVGGSQESFLRDTAGSAVTVSNPCVFVPDSGTIQGSTSASGAPMLLSLDQGTVIIGAGYNDINAGVLNPNGYSYTQANTLANIAGMVAKLTPLVKHFLILGIFYGEATLVEGTGGLGAGQSTLGVAASSADSQAALNDLLAINSALAAAYPNNFVDLQAAFIADGYGEIATVLGTNYTILNSTLLSDGVHTTTSATQAVYAGIIQSALTAKGW